MPCERAAPAVLPEHLEKGTITFQVQGGWYIPTDFHSESSTFVIEGDELRFEKLWFGTPRDDDVKIGCGHRFRRWR